MRPLSDTDIVRVWEHGRRASPVRRAVALLVAAGDGEDDRQLVGLTPGERDARLLSVRRVTFGNSLDCVAECPSCGEQLEFTVEASSLLPYASELYSADKRSATIARLDYRVTVHPPTIGELEQLSPLGKDTVLDRCIEYAERDGHAITAAELPDAVVNAIDEHLGAADPAAVTELSMSCPACAHAWNQIFDIVAFLWAEIAARAERLFHEVHTLARAYGWSESAILELGSIRRERYLEMVRG